MMSLRSGDVVWVEFPFVELDQDKARPALVINHAPIGPGGNLLWLMMITSAVHDRWPGDVEIHDINAAGLPIPSIVRTAKLATRETSRGRYVGRLVEGDYARVLEELRCALPQLLP